MAFFDLEATGVDVVKDRIIEIAILKVYPDGKEEVYCQRVNPEIPIKPDAIKVHGITNEDLKDEPTFVDLAETIMKFIEGCDLAGYNSNKFDIPMLAEEMLRANVDFDLQDTRFVDVQVVFFKREPRTLSAAYQFYCDKDLKDAHSAEADTLATYEILKAQLDRYSDVENDIVKLSEYTTQNKHADFAGRFVYNDKGQEVFNFGKHKGKVAEEVFQTDPSYFHWMMDGDFPLYTKKVVTDIKLRLFSKSNIKLKM